MDRVHQLTKESNKRLPIHFQRAKLANDVQKTFVLFLCSPCMEEKQWWIQLWKIWSGSFPFEYCKLNGDWLGWRPILPFVYHVLHKSKGNKNKPTIWLYVQANLSCVEISEINYQYYFSKQKLFYIVMMLFKTVILPTFKMDKCLTSDIDPMCLPMCHTFNFNKRHKQLSCELFVEIWFGNGLHVCFMLHKTVLA